MTLDDVTVVGGGHWSWVISAKERGTSTSLSVFLFLLEVFLFFQWLFLKCKKLSRLESPSYTCLSCSSITLLSSASVVFCLSQHQPLSYLFPPSLHSSLSPSLSVAHSCTGFISTTWVMWLSSPIYLHGHWLDIPCCFVSSCTLFLYSSLPSSSCSLKHQQLLLSAQHGRGLLTYGQPHRHRWT